MKKILLLILVLVMSFPVWARKPAVEPVMGISIDNEPKVQNPSLSKGFEFTPYQEVKRGPQSVSTAPEAKPQEVDRVTPLFFILVMLVLPVGLWFGIMKNIKGTDKEVNADKVKELKNFKKDNHDDFKKAS